jgi:hypothetical protein
MVPAMISKVRPSRLGPLFRHLLRRHLRQPRGGGVRAPLQVRGDPLQLGGGVERRRRRLQGIEVHRLGLHRAARAVPGVELHLHQGPARSDLHLLALAQTVLDDALPLDQRAVGAGGVDHEPAAVLVEELGVVVGDLGIALGIEAHVAVLGAADADRRLPGGVDPALPAARQVRDADHSRHSPSGRG